MTDRNVQYPYRFHVRPVPGTDDICEIIPAPGTVYENGTFWNKQNVLQDITAALYDKGPDATPDDIFAEIGLALPALGEKCNVEMVSYVGTGTYGAANPTVISFSFAPKIIWWLTKTLDNAALFTELVPETYTKDVLFLKSVSGTHPSGDYSFDVFGKKSPDGKTISTYAVKTQGGYGFDGWTPGHQMNAIGTTYKFLAIG